MKTTKFLTTFQLKIADYRRSLEQLKESCLSLKNSKTLLTNEVRLLKQQNKTHKEELLQVKQVCAGKERQLEHKVAKLQLEVDRLKEMCGEDIGQFISYFVCNGQDIKGFFSDAQQQE